MVFIAVVSADCCKALNLVHISDSSETYYAAVESLL